MTGLEWAVLPMEMPDQGLWRSLRRVALRIYRAAFQQRLLGADPDDPYRGLLLSDQEVDRILSALAERFVAPSHPVLSELQRAEKVLEEGLDQALCEGSSRWGNLVSRLGLSPLERDLFLLALLPEVDPRYGRLIAFLQDDVTRTRPGPFLAIRFLLPPAHEDAVWACLLPDAPLRRHLLLRLEAPSHDPTAPWLQQALVPDERITRYLLAGSASDEQPFPFLHRAHPGPPLEQLKFASSLRAALQALVEPLATGRVCLLLLEGAPGSGRRTVARALASALGRPLLELTRPPGENNPLSPEAARLAAREACLQEACLFVRDAGPLFLDAWSELARSYGVPVWLATEGVLPPQRLPERTVRVCMAWPDRPLRRTLWERALDSRPCETGALDEVASRYRLLGGHIRDAASWAEGLAYLHGRHTISRADLEEAVAAVVMPTLDDLARPVPVRHRWDELVVPEDTRAHLREFAAAIRKRDQVYDAWGFDRQRPLGRGLNALFTGPSGTGKTMAAEIVAGELGLPLFKIDLSAVVSKYVGETEKHLRRLFAEAERANAILFFDEADALFGKRSEVSDAHDRYANIEVAYLLQALEDHAGVCILATNLLGNMDDAFVRRMHFVVHFPFPDEPARRRIWEVVFPKEAPLGQDVNLDELAHRFRVTGGHIRNIALGAAFLAAEDGQVITMAHLLQAARREFQKMGKMIDEADFAPSKAQGSCPAGFLDALS